MSAVPYIALIASIAALGLAYYFAQVVLAADQGTDLMKEIGQAIQEGAMAFLRREYQWVSAFVAAMFVLLLIVPIDGRPYASFAYLFGAVLSSAAGFVGMRIATEANTRTANAARNGAADALPLKRRASHRRARRPGGGHQREVHVRPRRGVHGGREAGHDALVA